MQVLGKHHYKDMGGSQCNNDSSPNLSFNDLKQKKIEIKEVEADWSGAIKQSLEGFSDHSP